MVYGMANHLSVLCRSGDDTRAVYWSSLLLVSPKGNLHLVRSHVMSKDHFCSWALYEHLICIIVCLHHRLRMGGCQRYPVNKQVWHQYRINPTTLAMNKSCKRTGILSLSMETLGCTLWWMAMTARGQLTLHWSAYQSYWWHQTFMVCSSLSAHFIPVNSERAML